MSPRPDVSQERKDQILAAATKVFTERGFAEARMDDIVAESGLSKGALYWYFDSKDAIIISLLDRVFDWETANLQAILERQDSAAHKLTAFVEVTIQDLNKMKPLMPIFIDFWSLSLRKKTINQAIKRYYQRFLDILEPILQLGIDQDEFRPVDVNESALAIGAVFEGTILLWAYFSETVDIEKQFRSNLDLVLNGLVAES
jgi:TetR/AcrR family fatty acid metabolism transcriptional regulator